MFCYECTYLKLFTFGELPVLRATEGTTWKHVDDIDRFGLHISQNGYTDVDYYLNREVSVGNYIKY